ncbi:MAG: substrate-binding domain-containing protein [Armatimonadota bacterium]
MTRSQQLDERRSLRGLPLLTASLLVMALAVGCGKEPAGGVVPDELKPITEGPTAATAAAGKTVGITLLNKQHIFYRDLEQSMRDKADELGLTLLIQSAEFDANVQDAQVDDFIVQKVDALIVCPADSASVGGSIRKANGAGIPVFTCDIAADEGEVVCHIASDNVQGGRLAAEYLAKEIGEEGEVLVIDHPTVRSVQDRTKGFREVMAKYPKIEVVEYAPAEGQRDKAQQVMQNKLLSYPDLKGVFGINDDSALGALAAIRNAPGAEDIIIVGYDATPEALEEIRKGTQLKADIAQYPVKMGQVTIQMVADYFEGKPVPKEQPIEVAVVDRESLAAESAPAAGHGKRGPVSEGLGR